MGTVNDYVHPKMLCTYQLLESIALQYRIKQSMKTRIWLSHKGYEIRMQKQSENTKWSKIAPLAPLLEEPLADIGPLSDETIRELKDDLEEKIWEIRSTN